MLKERTLKLKFTNNDLEVHPHVGLHCRYVPQKIVLNDMQNEFQKT